MKAQAQEVLRYVTASTLWGLVLVVASPTGIRALRLLQSAKGRTPPPDELSGSRLVWDKTGLRALVQQIQRVAKGESPCGSLPLDLVGTAFQKKVWRQLLRIPRGTTCSYKELARRVGKPRAVRAVAQACARNPIGLVVPCHRVVRSDGSLGGYYWGAAKKRQLLEMEGARPA